MSSPASRAEAIKRLAAEEGLDAVGIARPDPSDHAAFLTKWLSAGRHAGMSWMARPDGVARRADVRTVMEGVRAVLVGAQSYAHDDPAGVPEDPARGVVARYARGRDYHRVLKRALLRVHRRFEETEGRPVPARAYVDTGPILERELAARAGLGWFGRNTMLIHPRRGSFFFLGVLLLGVEVEEDEVPIRDHCGTCRACLDGCPTGALLGRDGSGAPVMDAARCISYLTIEHRGAIPHELRASIGNRIFGCDICQEVCPFNLRFSEEGGEPAYAARGPGERPRGVQLEPARDTGPDATDQSHPGTDGPPLVALLEMTRAGWEEFSRGSAIRRVGRTGFLRNVAVALGNWGAAEAVPALARALVGEESLVRAHAAWALGRIGARGGTAADEARAALSSALARETDPSVRAEISSALAAG
jgi:epoxyqueuosine reductase